MTIRRLGIVQWIGLGAGAAALAVGHILGYGLSLAQCNAGGRAWGIGDPVEASLLGIAALLAAVAGAASLWVVVATRTAHYDDAPPLGRVRFLAIAAAVADLFFVLILLLDLFGNVLNDPCRGA